MTAPSDDVLVMAAPGPRLDGVTAPAFKGRLLDAIGQGNSLVALDLSAVDFMDSIGLAALMSCLKSLGGQGEIVLYGVGDKLRKLFAITKLDQGVFRIFDDQSAALAALGVRDE